MYIVVRSTDGNIDVLGDTCFASFEKAWLAMKQEFEKSCFENDIDPDNVEDLGVGMCPNDLCFAWLYVYHEGIDWKILEIPTGVV